MKWDNRIIQVVSILLPFHIQKVFDFRMEKTNVFSLKYNHLHLNWRRSKKEKLKSLIKCLKFLESCKRKVGYNKEHGCFWIIRQNHRINAFLVYLFKIITANTKYFLHAWFWSKWFRHINLFHPYNNSKKSMLYNRGFYQWETTTQRE